MLKRETREEVTIEKIVAGGHGLGRAADGQVVLVRHVLPGERVTVAIRERKKDYLLADPVAITHNSPLRVIPPCPLYTRCGGCDFQHISRNGQHQYKMEVFAETIRRGGARVRGLTDAVFLPLLASPESFAYRQRIRLHCDDRGRLGFHRFHSHEVEPVSACPLARPEINSVLGAIRLHRALAPLLVQTSALELLFNPDGREVVALFHFSRRPRPADIANAVSLREGTPGLGRLFFIIKGQGVFTINGVRAENEELLLSFTLPWIKEFPGPTLSWEAGGFCQINLAQNENLIRTVMEWVAEERPSELLDLFCGMGNFSIPLSRIAGRVHGIDGQGAAIRSAKRNAKAAGRDNCTFSKKPVAEAVRELIGQGRAFPLVLIDPPRQGAPDIISLLPALKPRRIIIVSCDPATLARDLDGLMLKGFTVERILAVDMFPQTHHLESVSLLTG